MQGLLTTDVTASLEASPYAVDLGPSMERYRYWLTLYHHMFGRLPGVVPVGAVDPREGPPLRSLVCDHAFFRDNVVMGSVRTFEHSPRLLAHVAGLGYQAWNCRCFNQIPTVETYMTLHRQTVGADFGFDLEVSGVSTPRLGFFDWFERCLRNVFAIHLTTREYFDALALRASPTPTFSPHSPLTPHVVEVVHDISQHVLNYHYYPKELLTRLASRFRDALSDAEFERCARAKPGPLAGFYDNDLNVYSYALWARVDDPGDFPNAAVEPRNLEQLLAVVEKRIRETAVPGPTRNVERATFDVRRSGPRA